MQERVLIEIALTAETQRVAWEDMIFPVSDPYAYEGRIISPGAITSRLADLTSSSAASQKISFSLADIDGKLQALREAEDWRGKVVTIKRADIDTDTVLETHTFTVDKITIKPGESVTVSCEEQSMDMDTTDFPRNKITLTSFPDVPDGSDALDQTINSWFGPCKNIPLYNIYEDLDNDYYDYLIGYGTIDGVDAVYRDGDEADSGDYTVYDGSQSSPHGGYAFVRFTRRQRGHSGGMLKITADITGLEIGGSYTTNPVTALKEWITNTTWGRGESVDSTSFTAAETAAAALNLKIGGGLQGKKNGELWKREFLKACRDARWGKNANGYTIEIPEYSSSAEAAFTDRDIVPENMDEANAGSYVSTVKVDYYFDPSENKYLKNLEESISVDYGKEQTFKLELVTDDETAGRFLQYKTNRIELQDRKIKFKALSGAEDLTRGSIISITSTVLGLSGASYEVLEIKKQGTDYSIIAQPNLSSIYTYSAPTYPGDVPDPPSSSPPDDVTGLSVTASSEVQNDGTVLSWFDGEYTAPTENFLHAKISIKLSSGATWQDIGTTDDGDFKIGNLTPGEEYDIKLVSVNGSGLKSSGATLTDELAAGDSSAPSTPSGFSVNDAMGQVVIDWSDNSEDDLDHYNVYRNSSKIAETRSSKFYDNPPAYNTNYSYQVTAVDHSGNESSKTSGQNGKKLQVNGADIDIKTGDITLATGCDLEFTSCCTLEARYVNPTYWLDFLPSSEYSRLELGSPTNPWRYLRIHTDQYLRLQSDTEIDLGCDGGDINIFTSTDSGGDIGIDADENMELRTGDEADEWLFAYLYNYTGITQPYSDGGGAKTKYHIYRDGSGYVRAKVLTATP